MNISTLLSTQSPGAKGLSKNTTVNIDTPLDTNGRKLYRHLYYLHFLVDPSSDGIVIDTSASVLQGSFHDYTLPLTANNLSFQTKVWQAITEAENPLSNLVKVHLTHPWTLQSVSTVDKRGVEVLRLDGEIVSSEPTISGNANSTFANKFVGQDFALRKVKEFPTPKPIKKHFGTKSRNDLSLEEESNLSEISIDVGNEIVMTASHGIKTINLKSFPTGPRILLGEIGQLPTLEDKLLSIWQQSGQQTEEPVYFLTEDQAWQAALQQIQKACDRYFASLLESSTPPSSPLYLPIVFESDTPVRLRLIEFKLEYGLLRNHLDDIQGKHTLKFSGTTIETQQLPLKLPAGCNIKHATLTLNNNLKNGFDLTDATALANTDKLHTGVNMTEGRSVASHVHNTEPQKVDCIVVAVLPLADEIKATLQIVQDVNNGPNGSILSQTQMTLKQPYVRQWAVANFATPTLLDIGDFWLRLTIQQGQLFWFGETGDGAVYIQQNEKVDRKVNTLRLQNKFGISKVKSNNSVDMVVRIVDTPASLREKLNSDLIFDLADGLNEHYGTGRSTPALVNFTTGRKGNLTIKAVEVIYEI